MNRFLFWGVPGSMDMALSNAISVLAWLFKRGCYSSNAKSATLTHRTNDTWTSPARTPVTIIEIFKGKPRVPWQLQVEIPERARIFVPANIVSKASLREILEKSTRKTLEKKNLREIVKRTPYEISLIHISCRNHKKNPQKIIWNYSWRKTRILKNSEMHPRSITETNLLREISKETRREISSKTANEIPGERDRTIPGDSLV